MQSNISTESWRSDRPDKSARSSEKDYRYIEREAYKLQDIKWLAQGTIYPDIIESLSITA